MLKALVPIDGSANSLGAVRHVIKLVKDREPLEIHLLNVQPPMHGDVTMFISGSVLKEFHQEQAAKALASACRLLDGVGVPSRGTWSLDRLRRKSLHGLASCTATRR